MTLIAKYTIEGFQMIFGDLLTTGPISSDAPGITIPAQGNVKGFFELSDWGISGLNQKVNLISDNCVIAWAGSWIGARVIISDLRKLAKERPLTLNDLANTIDNNPELEKHPTQFVGLIHDENEIIGFSSDAEEFESETLKDLSLGGTGAEAVKQFSDILKGFQNGGEAGPSFVARGIAKSLLLGSLLLNTEFREGTLTPTLQSMFGGGYEIAFFADGKMQKLPEVTFIFWDAIVTDKSCSISMPSLVVKQSYANDHLLIRSVRLGQKSDVEFEVLNEESIIVKPMFETTEKPSKDLMETLSMSSSLLCHCILTRDEEKFLGICSLVENYPADSVHDMTFSGKGKKWAIGFTSMLLDRLCSQIQREFGPKKSSPEILRGINLLK